MRTVVHYSAESTFRASSLRTFTSPRSMRTAPWMSRSNAKPSRYAKLAEAPAQFRRARLLELRITYDLAFDRLVHGSVRIDLGDVNVRKLLAGRK